MESIISQSFTDFEVHIIDGVSKDNTLEIVKSFNDKRIQILSEIDNGIYDAMNKGIKLAKGKWLYFLGSDDQLFDSRVLNEIYITSKHTRSKVIYGSVKILG
ncbi:MAG: glycosyltransferase, partial [Paludibacter sp.]